MTSDIFLKWFTGTFLPETAHLRTEMTPVVLLVDGFKAHVTDAFVEKARAGAPCYCCQAYSARHTPSSAAGLGAREVPQGALRLREAAVAGAEQGVRPARFCEVPAWPAESGTSPQPGTRRSASTSAAGAAFSKPGVVPFNPKAMEGLGCDSRAAEPAKPVSPLDVLVEVASAPDPEALYEQRRFLESRLPAVVEHTARQDTGGAVVLTADGAWDRRMEKAAEREAEDAKRAARKLEQAVPWYLKPCAQQERPKERRARLEARGQDRSSGGSFEGHYHAGACGNGAGAGRTDGPTAAAAPGPRGGNGARACAARQPARKGGE